MQERYNGYAIMPCVFKNNDQSVFTLIIIIIACR